MAFKTVLSLDTDEAVSLGGVNRQTGKANPTRAEGYFLGSCKVASRKAKSGFSFLHVLQTEKGNLGVWGKTDLDRKLSSVAPGTMVRITQSGKKATPYGDMYKFTVEEDRDNIIDVSGISATESQEADAEEAVGAVEEAPESDAGEEEPALDEVPAPRAAAPRVAARAPSAEAQAKVKATLAGLRRS